MRARLSFALMLPALLLAVLVAAGRQATAEELLFNGDFSQGKAGWWADPNLGFEIDCAGHTADPAARLYLNDGGDGWIESSAVPIEPGGTYEASGYAHFVAGGDPAPELLLALDFYESADGTGDSLPGMPLAFLAANTIAYTPMIGSITAPQRAHSARLRVDLSASGPAAACVDDLSLAGPRPSPTETPTPTSPAPSRTPTSPPTPTVSPTATATEVPMPWASILNGGFEEGAEDIPAGWQKFGGFLYRSADFPRSGSFAGAFSSFTDSTKWVYQPLSVDPGRSYAFHGFVLKNGPPDSTVLLRISWYSSSDASGSSFASSDSPEFLSGSDPSFRYLSSGSVTAPQEAHSARARIVLAPVSAAPETIYLDDFALEATASPTPASGGESGEGTPLGGQAAADESEPPSGHSPGNGSDSGGGIRSSGRASATPTPQARGRRAYEDSPYAVKISEVLANAGAGSDDAVREWVELYNAGLESVELGGWSLADNVAADTVPPVALPSGAYAVVAASSDFRRQYPAFQGALLILADGRIGNGLANESDRLLLLDEEGRPVDALSYGVDHEFFEPPAPAVPPGHSLERFPSDRDTDTAADFRDNAYPSPGAGSTAGITPTVAASPISQVRGQALSAIGGGGDPSWPWFLLAAGLVFVGGTGAGAAGVLFWLARGRPS